MTVVDFAKKKNQGIPISMVTSYDSWSAALVAQSQVDCILVGDSIGMTLYGYTDTLPVTIETMAAHVAAVRRGAPEAFIVGDMPFLAHRMGLEKTMENVALLMRAGANAVKMEGASGHVDIIRHIVESGVPVMGHLGLTPQSVHAFGGFRVQGKSKDAKTQLLEDIRLLEDAGCFSLVLEAVPAATAAQAAQSVSIPIIGIGAGAEVDGQVLVLQDLLGLTSDFKPKFVRRFLDGASLVVGALDDYHREVTTKGFPKENEQYS